MAKQSNQIYGFYVGGKRKGSEIFTSERVTALLEDAKRSDARDVDDTAKTVLTSTDQIKYKAEFKPILNEQSRRRLEIA